LAAIWQRSRIEQKEQINMALIKFSGLLSAISGKVGGTVFARNKAGAYSRNWAKPTSSPTPIQSANRARFGSQSAFWGSLTSAQRTSWNASASGLIRVNRLGEEYVPTGRQICLQANNQLVASAQTEISTPPADFTPPTIDPGMTATAVETAGIVTSLELSSTPIDTTKIFSVEAAGQSPNTKTNFTNQYRQIGTFPLDGDVPDLLSAYIAVFGNVAAAGNQIYLRVKTVDVSNGQASAPLIIVATLT
jgi:hypothetical protein